MQAAEDVWKSLGERDWLEAFFWPPPNWRFKYTAKNMEILLNGQAESKVALSLLTKEVLIELAEFNQRYLKKFGFIFIVCATGKSASEMLELLKERISNNRETELLVAAEEQFKITKIRLEKLL